MGRRLGFCGVSLIYVYLHLIHIQIFLTNVSVNMCFFLKRGVVLEKRNINKKPYNKS